jgi:hypothetical protein
MKATVDFPQTRLADAGGPGVGAATSEPGAFVAQRRIPRASVLPAPRGPCPCSERTTWISQTIAFAVRREAARERYGGSEADESFATTSPPELGEAADDASAVVRATRGRWFLLSARSSVGTVAGERQGVSTVLVPGHGAPSVSAQRVGLAAEAAQGGQKKLARAKTLVAACRLHAGL